MSSFTQEEKDYYLLIVRDFTPRERDLVWLVLTSLAEAAKGSNEPWSAKDLEEVAKLTKGETT